MSRGHYFQIFFLILLCLLAAPGFYRSTIDDSGETTAEETEHVISLSPKLEKTIPATLINLRTTTPQEKELIRHRLKTNINTATRGELKDLDGIGSVTAEKIISHRETHGKFSDPRDIVNVSGIGAGTYQNIKSNIRTSEAPGVSGGFQR